MKLNKITVKANAKLNLFLDIIGRRGDGYHDILTTMCLIDLADDVSVTVGNGNGISVTCDDSGISENTAYKATSLFLAKAGVRRDVNISINKKIPVMAGLGGSSADAAAVLYALNALFGEPLTLEELMKTGAEIGSDVPFCIHGGFALCKSTGTEIAETFPLLDCVFVIVKPDFCCSSKEAYALYAKNSVPRVQWRGEGHLYNVFEELYANSEIAEIKRELTALGASGAGMTGSGSAVFGIFKNRREANKAFESLKYRKKFTAVPVQRPPT
ncbi:MAG: 4-(cytidine 5'-diphospho)-2-C-methyl-D-erythritol kinase [Oscillospiraceae bacterium]|nr:4-(cytidine 5'-diphospho)-2-C-methyl-D-erythritol kinase [Oscillospiraceae bacterium]